MKIPGVIHRRAQLSHEDERRFLFSIYNGDLGGFTAAQIKWFDFKSDGWVGKHYHHFAEIFCIIRGGGVYDFVDVTDPQRREIFEMQEGDVVLVPAKVAHRALVKKGSLVIAANDQPYVSAKVNDFKFDFNAGLKQNCLNGEMEPQGYKTIEEAIGKGSNVYTFSEGLAKVRFNDQWFHIWPNGRPLYEKRFMGAGDFHEGVAWVIENDQCYHIGPNGLPAYEARYDYNYYYMSDLWGSWPGPGEDECIRQSGDFHEGLAWVVEKYKWFHIRHDGQPAYTQRYDRVWDFENGQAKVWLFGKEREEFFIRPDGTRI